MQQPFPESSNLLNHLLSKLHNKVNIQITSKVFLDNGSMAEIFGTLTVVFRLLLDKFGF